MRFHLTGNRYVRIPGIVFVRLGLLAFVGACIAVRAVLS